jgi:glutamine synthetase
VSLDLAALRSKLQNENIDVLRLVYADVLGIPRSKDLLVSQMEKAAAHGPAFCQGVWVTTTRGGVLDGHGSISDGLSDFVSRIDPSTIKNLPWEPGVAYAIVDAFEPNGDDNPVAPRTALQRVLKAYEEIGLTPVIGPELEFYLAKQENDVWVRALHRTGRVYTTGAIVDPDGTFLHILRMLDQMDIGVFAGNHEFAPAQYEINIWHGEALEAADRTFLFKTAIKDIAVRRGYNATFLGKPWAESEGSGFHLHFSVVDSKGKNQMHKGEELSEVAQHMIAGILGHANALTAFTNPTINAFKRLGPDTLAPSRANWGYDNRATLLRVPPERGEGTRLEIRIGDGAANPYLMVASVLAAGLDGIKRKLSPSKAAEGWAYENDADPLRPLTFTQALDALEADPLFAEQMGATVIATHLTLKRDEIERYEAEVPDPSTREITSWELDEYIWDY